MYQELYENLQPEFETQFTAVGLSYEKEFNKAYRDSKDSKSGAIFEHIVRVALEVALKNYVNTEGKTKSGGFFRKVGKLILSLFGNKTR